MENNAFFALIKTANWKHARLFLCSQSNFEWYLSDIYHIPLLLWVELGVEKNSIDRLPASEWYFFQYQFYLICFNKRLHYTYLWSALSLGVIWCFSCETQEYSQSIVLLDLGTTSMLHVCWLTDAGEVNSFGLSTPNFDIWHFSILDCIEAVQSVPWKCFSLTPSPNYE